MTFVDLAGSECLRSAGHGPGSSLHALGAVLAALAHGLLRRSGVSSDSGDSGGLSSHGSEGGVEGLEGYLNTKLITRAAL